MAHQIPEESLERERRYVMEELKEAGFYELIEENCDNGIRLSDNGIKVCETVEKLVSVYSAIRDYLDGFSEGDLSLSSKNAFSLYAGCQAGLEELGGYGKQQDEGLVPLDLGNGKKGLVSEIINKYETGLKKVKELEKRESDSLLLEWSSLFLEGISKLCLEEKSREDSKYLDDLELEVGDAVIKGFTSFVRHMTEDRRRYTFDEDYGGNEEVINELKTIAKVVKSPEIYKKWGARTPKAILFVGPPGTGKTLAARCFAGEIDAPFNAYSYKDVGSKFVSEQPTTIAKLFDQEGVVFYDELDTIARKRGEGAHEVTEQSVNAINTALDGFKSKDDERFRLFIFATNRPDIIDDSVMSRIEKVFYLGYPDENGIKAIWNVHQRKAEQLAGRKLFRDLDYDFVAKKLEKLRVSGRDIENTAAQVTKNKADLELATGKEPDLITTEDVIRCAEKNMSSKEREWETGYDAVDWLKNLDKDRENGDKEKA